MASAATLESAVRTRRPGAVRVALFAHRLMQHHATGVGRYLRELVIALKEVADGEHAITVASTREPQSADWVPDSVERRVVLWSRRPVQAAWCLGLGPRLERSLGAVDVAHLIQPFPPVRTAAPQVVMVHDLFPLEHREWYRRSEHWTYRRSMELALRRATTIVVPSRYIADRLRATLNVDAGRVEVVPLGVSGTFSQARSDDDLSSTCARFGVEPGRFVVCLGAVSTRKNVVPLVRAAGRLRGDRLPIVLVGPDGHGVELVEAEIARLRGTARVIRTGFLPDEDAAALVQAAAVLAHPALGEGFGFVPLEAMAAGTPVIAAATSSIPEVVGDAAALVGEPTQPESWADALSDVVRHPERQATLAAAGARRAADFSWKRTAAMMLEVYSDAARG